MSQAIHITIADDLLIVGYFLLLLAIGMWSRKLQATSADYFAGGHQIPWWMAGISHYMSGFSAFAFVVYSQMAYVYGWVAITIFWTGVPACIAGGLLFARRWRRARVVTPLEFLEQRCNFKVRQLFVWSGIPVKLFDDALKIFATALFLSVVAGIGFDLSIALCGLIVVAYTVSGGLFALVIADYVQFLMKTLAILLLFPLAIFRMHTLHRSVGELPASLFHLTAGPYGWIYLLSYAAVVLISYNGNWALAQKYYSVPDEQSATRAAYLSAALTFVGAPIMFLPAILGRLFLPDLIAQHRTQDAFVLLLANLLPAGMVGIVIAAMFSATMAAVSSDINAIAGVLTKDWYQRVVHPDASERNLLYIGRLFTLLLGLVITGLSLWVAHSGLQSLFQMMVSVFGVLAAPTLLPILCLLVWKKISASGVFTGFTGGLLVGVGFTVIRQVVLGPRHLPEAALLEWEGLGIFANIFATLAGMYLGSKLWPAAVDEAQRSGRFFLRMEEPVLRSESTPDTAMARPGRVIGIATITVGCLLAAAGLISGSPTARYIDLACGACLAVLGSQGVLRKQPRSRQTQWSAVDSDLPQ